MWAIFLGATLFKEFYWDTHWEIPIQTMQDGMIDFLSYQAGAGLGLLISWMKIIASPEKNA